MNKFQLANYITARYPGKVSPMKLQKLLYYCYAWQLVANEKKFDATFEAWTHGPVEPQIYNNYKKFGSKPIPSFESSLEGDTLLDFILDSYEVYSAIELSKTTHHELPWKKYKDTGEVIPDEILVSYYSQQPFANNFPLEDEKPYYPPKTSSHYSFTFDMEKDYVPVFQDITEYVNSFKEAEKMLKGVLHSYGIKH